MARSFELALLFDVKATGWDVKVNDWWSANVHDSQEARTPWCWHQRIDECKQPYAWLATVSSRVCIPCRRDDDWVT